MPRRARIVLPNVPLHLIQRGNNRQACFFADEDYRNYLDWLGEYAGKTGCRIHAYVLMTNHVHLLVSSANGGASGEMMKALGQRYVQYVNRVYRRNGTLWEGRYRSCPTQAEATCSPASVTSNSILCGRAWLSTPATTAGPATAWSVPGFH